MWRTKKAFSHLVVGLGNPGKKYEGTRHNIGFRVIEKLSQRIGVSKATKKGVCLYGEACVSQQDIIMIQPLTFMNRSGFAVAETLRKKRIPLQGVLVICDDLDLEVGTIRLRSQGSSGGHRGLNSIIQVTGTDQFSRLRLGIGKAPAGIETSDYVLEQPTAAEQKILSEAEDRAVEAVIEFLTTGIEQAMNKYN